MTQRARQTVRALTQAQRVRNVQSQAARADLDRALLTLNAARHDLAAAEAKRSEDMDHWNRALASEAFDTHAARYWPVAVAESQARVDEQEDAAASATQTADLAQVAWRTATNRADAVARPLKRARRRLDQAIEDRGLNEAADRFLTRGHRP